MPNSNSKSLISRRTLLKAAGLGGLVTSLYSYYRGLRFPTLSWEPRSHDAQMFVNNVNIALTDVIQTPTLSSLTGYRFRAYAPEPIIRFNPEKDTSINFDINNISPDAKLTVSSGKASQAQETINGIDRHIELSLKAGQPISLEWNLPTLTNYTFAAIGDSGGDRELEWCIQRAHQLGARFLLHLGDFNYQKGDYENAIKLFNKAPIPCYISIGNHDFNDSGLIYQPFLDEIGPLNNAFSIGKTRFINIDTAANFLPFSGGQRGELIEQISKDSTDYANTVVFTHRPLHDPQPLHDRQIHGDHDIGSDGERDWLIGAFKKLKTTSMLCGHIHIFNRSTYHGIDTIIVGQGLGHQDLLVNDNQISKIAIGHVNQAGNVDYSFAPLAMPMELHCHPRVQEVKDAVMQLPHGAKIKEIEAACNQ